MIFRVPYPPLIINDLQEQIVRLRTVSIAAKSSEMTKINAWMRAFRLHFVPPSVLPAFLCGMMAWGSARNNMDLTAFLLVVAAVAINHFGLNMMDDAFDYIHFVDEGNPAGKNPYTGGSGVITQGILTERELIIAASVCFSVTAAIGFYLAHEKGWPVLAFGFFGLLSSIFYTVPPVKFGYRGFGEGGLLVNFGPVIGMGAYYVQSGNLTLEPFMVSLVLGFMMWSMIVINEIPDYECDRRAGKMNLVARFGREKGIVLYEAGLLCAYAILIMSAALGIAPAAVLLGLVSVPLAVKSSRILRYNYGNPQKMIPANLAMIKVHLYTGLGMIAGYSFHLTLAFFRVPPLHAA